MPLFEYACNNCDHEFEALVMGNREPECPECHGRSLEKLISGFAVGGDAPSAVNAAGSCGTCGDPRGPGT